MITILEAFKAMREAGTPEGYFITLQDPYTVADETTVYHVGHTNGPRDEWDLDGDPTGFKREADGTVTCVGAIF